MFKNKGSLPIYALIAAVVLVAAIFVTTKVQPPGKGEPKAPTLLLPSQAQAGQAIVALGEAVDPGTGKLVEGYAFIDYKKEFAKPPWAGGEKKEKCYDFLGKGQPAKWKTVEPWIVNPSNTRNLDETFVFNNLSSDIVGWEDAADGTVDGVLGADILGDGSSTSDILIADTESPDDKNEVYFADIETEGAIAVAIVWGIFIGPPSERELVEWDQIYDDVDFDWSEDCTIDDCTSKMDFWNIAIHELGHSVGLGHPDDSCTEETMYRYTSEGETKKRDLNAGDITGIDELY